MHLEERREKILKHLVQEQYMSMTQIKFTAEPSDYGRRNCCTVYRKSFQNDKNKRRVFLLQTVICRAWPAFKNVFFPST